MESPDGRKRGKNPVLFPVSDVKHDCHILLMLHGPFMIPFYVSCTHPKVAAAPRALTCVRWFSSPRMSERWSTARTPTKALGFVVTVMATSPPASTFFGDTLTDTCGWREEAEGLTWRSCVFYLILGDFFFIIACMQYFFERYCSCFFCSKR